MRRTTDGDRTDLHWVCVRTALVCAGLVLGGCAAKRPAYDVPPIPVPKQFKQATSMAAVIEPGGGSRESEAKAEALAESQLVEWWRSLANPELNALVDRAIANNTDLRIATLRIVQANARAEQALADELPVLTAPYQAKNEAPRGGIGSVREGGTVKSSHTYQLSLRADWRADLWGERRSLAESAEMQLWRATYQRDDTRRTLIANVVSLYVEYLSLNDRIRVARETETVLRGMLDSVRGRMEIGDATITDMEQQRAAVYSVQATIPGLELQRENAANSLAQLLGVTPTSLALSARGLDSVNFPRALPGVPSNLLLRRPDVRVVESRLLAADADIDVARTRLLPPLDLTAQVGYGSLVFSRLIQGHNIFWNAIANLSATIFDNGKRSREVDFARAFHEELVETYVRVLYTAIRETEDAISAIQHNGKRLDAQRSATDAARHAWELSMESYAAGAIDYLTLLDTQRTYHRNLDEFHRVNMERHKGLVALFGALGGGVPKGGVLPGDGRRPVAEADAKADAALAPDQVGEKTDIQQYDPHPAGDEEYWLAEVVGLQDRSGIAHVWRDLNKRFPDLMAGRMLQPRAQGYVANEQQIRTAWYRVFVASFPSSAAAETFCGQLMEQLQRCRPVSSRSDAFREVKQLPSLPFDPPRLSDLIPPITRTADDGAQGHAGVQVSPVSLPAIPAAEEPAAPAVR